MDKVNVISQGYRQPKTLSQNIHQFSSGEQPIRTKRPQKLISINQSIPSTRDQSSNRSTTPTKFIENLRKRSISSKNPKENADLTLDQMKKQLDVIFQALPKIQKKLVRTHKEKKRKNINISYEDHKSESINKIYRPGSPYRSKSTFSTKKSCLPRINPESSELTDLQKYLIDFHQKSKFLLSQLEQKVLGKDSNN